MFQLLRFETYKRFAGVHTLTQPIKGYETKKLKGKLIGKAFKIKREFRRIY
jgi:hypothetical protein